MEYKIKLDSKYIKANGIYNLETERVKILKGSEIRKEEDVTKSISDKNFEIYNKLINDENFIKDNVFVQDYEFRSLSEAANVLLGSNVNGRRWFVLEENGKVVDSIINDKNINIFDYLEENIDKYKKSVETAEKELKNFREKYPLEKLDKMTKEDYDKVGNTYSFMNMIENYTQAVCSGSMGRNWNKLFYQQKDDNKYCISKHVIKNNPDYATLEYDEIFKAYLKELKQFIEDFDLDTYKSQDEYPCKRFISGANVLKMNFILLYKGSIMTSFTTVPRIKTMLDYLGIKYGYKEDSIELNRKLTNYIFENNPALKEYSLYQISACLHDYYTYVIESKKSYAVKCFENEEDQKKYFYDNSQFLIGYYSLGDLEEYDTDEDIFDKMKEIYSEDDLGILKLFMDLKKGNKLILHESDAVDEKKIMKVYAVGEVLKDYEEGYKFIEGKGHAIPVKWQRLEEPDEISDITYEAVITQIKGSRFKNIIDKIDNSKHTEDSVKKIGKNVIYYGVPGCGKSSFANKEARKLGEVERILFHPDYTYSDFVGQLLPQKHNDNNITYDFVPGPFTKILAKALSNPDEHYCLIIEEINRGNASAIFGDIFQLLDRLKVDNEGYKKGESEYRIKNDQITKYLKDKNVKVENHFIEEIYIPSNLTIFATMNSSDQNVFPLDTAFKRRWQFKKIANDFDDHPYRNTKILGTDITWQKFVDTLNARIRDLNKHGINGDDKQLGQFFLSQDELLDSDLFAEKILLYLWEDVVKLYKHLLFKEKYTTLDKLLSDFPNEKFKVFKDDLFNEE